VKVDQLKAESITAAPGTQVSLPCRVSYQTNNQWRNKKAVIYSNGRIKRNFIGRFAVGNTEDSHQALVITKSNESDSGIYECTEDNGKGRSVSNSV
jgi:hypothetical protein